MSGNKRAILVFGLAMFALLGFSVGKYFIGDAGAVRIGTKNFTEQIILGELLTQLIEAHSQIPVVQKQNLGGTFVCFQALQTGDLDLYVEYTGTGLTAILKQPPMTDPDTVYRLVSEQFKERWHLLWQEALGFNNTYAITMRREHARRLGIEKISDLADHKGDLLPGFNHEFLERPDGYPGLKEHYGFRFEKAPREMDSGLMYRAIAEKEVDVICGFATDGRIPAFDLVVLEDDKGFFPPYQAAPVIRAEVLADRPQLAPILALLANKIDNDTMARMNYQVDEEGQLPSRVARNFLVEQGLAGPDAGAF